MTAEPRTDELDIFDRPTRPYADAAHRYLEAGWPGVLPVGTRPRMKHEPPKGYTGREGAWPTADTIDAWTRELGGSNVGLRLPRGVAGIDVDAYDGKAGADTMAAAAAAHGRLPVTWRSTSREDGVSGIYLFRVPAGAEYGGQLVHPVQRSQSNVELIQYHHRYAIAAPSIHPEGRTYRWIGPDGAEAGIPRVDELPELPAGWQAHLAGSCGCYAAPEPVLTFTGPRDPVAEHLAEGHEALRAVGSRHEAVLPHALALVGFARRGSRQAADALEQLRVAFLAAVTTPGTGQRSAGEAEREWRRMTTEGQAATAGAGLPAWEDAPGVVTFRAERSADADVPELPDLADVATMLPPADLEREYVAGLLRPGKVFAIAAAEGVGKSMVRKELELRLATGTGALFGHYPVAAAVRVGTVDEENGADEEWRRDEAMLAALGLDRSALAGRYRRASFLGLNLAAAASQAYLRRQAAAGLDVLFLDTGGTMVDEEYGPPLKAAVRFLRALRREYPGLAVVLLVHMVKPSRDAKAAGDVKRRVLSDVMGQWTRQADVVAVMSDVGGDRYRWELAKRRGVPRSAGLIDYSSGAARWVADLTDDDVASTRDTLRVLRAIAAGADSWQAVATGCGLGKNPVFTAVRELRGDGLIHSGSPYRLTDDGLEALG